MMVLRLLSSLPGGCVILAFSCLYIALLGPSLRILYFSSDDCNARIIIAYPAIMFADSCEEADSFVSMILDFTSGEACIRTYLQYIIHFRRPRAKTR
jgi:hypothetical protein